jgi:hypothetical protein
MWLRCTSCEHKMYGSERDWGKRCPQGGCEGTLAFDDGFQRFYPVRRPNLMRRYFTCEKCHKVFSQQDLDPSKRYICPSGICEGRLFPI